MFVVRSVAEKPQVGTKLEPGLWRLTTLHNHQSTEHPPALSRYICPYGCMLCEV
jgi:hypothetical protein